jgi:hypothetical protein
MKRFLFWLSYQIKLLAMSCDRPSPYDERCAWKLETLKGRGPKVQVNNFVLADSDKLDIK